MSDQQPPRLEIVPPSEEPLPERYVVQAGKKDGWPAIELLDQETGTSQVFDVPTALAIAGMMAVAGSTILEELRRGAAPTPPAPKPKRDRPSLIGVGGKLLT